MKALFVALFGVLLLLTPFDLDRAVGRHPGPAIDGGATPRPATLVFAIDQGEESAAQERAS